MSDEDPRGEDPLPPRGAATTASSAAAVVVPTTKAMFPPLPEVLGARTPAIGAGDDAVVVLKNPLAESAASAAVAAVATQQRFVRVARAEGGYARSVLASATSAALDTRKPHWFSCQLCFYWERPAALAALVPAPVWESLVLSVDRQLRLETRPLWRYMLGPWLSALVALSLIAPGAAKIAADVALGPPPGRSRPNVGSAGIMLVAIGVMIAFCTVFWWGVMRGCLADAQRAAAGRVADFFNATLAPWIRDEHARLAKSGAATTALAPTAVSPARSSSIVAAAVSPPPPVLAAHACYCPSSMPVEHNPFDRDEDDNLIWDGTPFVMPSPVGALAQLTAPLGRGGGRRAMPVLHVVVGVPAFQHPLYGSSCCGLSGREYADVYADEVVAQDVAVPR